MMEIMDIYLLKDKMKNVIGHIEGLYNLIADYSDDARLLFSDFLGINKEQVNVKLRSSDISAQIIVSSKEIQKKCDSKIIFIVNRLNEYETHEAIQESLTLLSNLIKIKDRSKKLLKLKSQMI